LSDALATTAPASDAPFERQTLHPMLDRIQMPALLAGLVGCALLVLGLLVNREQFFRSYLYSYLFWIGIPLGSGALLMLQHLTGGAWGLAIRRLLESGTRMILLMAILFLPLMFGLKHIYVWAQPDHGGVDLHGKEAYLNPASWAIRAAVCFVLWIVGAFLLNTWSMGQDRSGDPKYIRRLQLLSAPGLAIYVLTVTLATVDWVMSIDPHWYSTIYSLIFISGQALATLAFCIVMLALLTRRPPMAHVITRDHFHDLGNLLFAFTMLWAYMSFSQFIIIWSANIAEEVPYYTIRMDGFQKVVGLLLVFLHFLVPFVLLLSRKFKRSVRWLAGIASLILVMRFVDLFWIVIPTFYQGTHAAQQNVLPHWLDFVSPVAIGGIWIFVYIWQLRRRPLIPPHDPRLGEVAH
jgi:hypothetical protein